MTKTSIVVEGQTDVLLLRKVLLERELAELRFFATEGRISLSTVARNIIVEEGFPVFVIMDANTLDERSAEEARLDTLATIRYVAGTIPIDAYAFVPEMEVVCFQSPSVLERALGRRIADIDVQKGLSEPRRTLEALLRKFAVNRTLTQFLDDLDEMSLHELRESKQMRGFIDRLHRFTGLKKRRVRARP
jgi:hypothetical protein